jgi:hypothetical protein
MKFESEVLFGFITSMSFQKRNHGLRDHGSAAEFAATIYNIITFQTLRDKQ